MKTYKLNRIEIEKKDWNVELVIDGGVVGDITVNIKPNGKRCITIETDIHQTCGCPHLTIETTRWFGAEKTTILEEVSSCEVTF